jgi:hypothetical protein
MAELFLAGRDDEATAAVDVAIDDVEVEGTGDCLVGETPCILM